MPKLRIKDVDGSTEELECSNEAWKTLSSADTDGTTKEELINLLRKASKLTRGASVSVAHPLKTFSSEKTCGTPSILSQEPFKKSSSTTPCVTPPISPSEMPLKETSTSSVHAWTSKEENVLVAARHNRDELFNKSKNHNLLWKEIADEIGTVTPLQAMHKYNNLKKRWKEVIDSGTGTEAKYFRHREAFDLQYGTRSSNRPSFIIDSTDDTDEAQLKEMRTEKKATQPKMEKKATKRVSSEMIDLIKQQDEEFTNKIQQFHNEKMARYDRFLDILEAKNKKE